MKRRELLQHLERHGCYREREGAKHSIYHNPANGRCAAVPRHREIKDTTARTICDQLGIPRPKAKWVIWTHPSMGTQVGSQLSSTLAGAVFPMPTKSKSRITTERAARMRRVLLARSTRFPAYELRRIRAIIITKREEFLEAWYGWFGE